MKTRTLGRSTPVMALALALTAIGAGRAALAADPIRLAAADTSRAAAAVKPAPSAQGCIALKTVAEQEIVEVDARGERVTRVVPATKIVPGDQVIWTITAANVCSDKAERVSIDNPVPQHMSYVPESANVAGADVRYSLDGRRFGVAGELSVAEADGRTRPARADEYTHIRWSFANPVGPGQVAIARYRAALK